MSRNKLLLRGRCKQGRGSPALTSDDDASEIKGYWESLGDNERLRVLHFDDQAIAEQVYSVQKECVRSDMMCFNLGIHGQDAVREDVGMHFFNMEVKEHHDTLRPVAFFAKLELVERDDFFEYIEKQLGRPFLQGRPAIHRRDWPSLFQPPARSWRDLMSQILQLVEYAILHAHQEYTTQIEIAEACAQKEMSAMPAASAEQSQSAKRRARKKKNIAAARDAASCLSSLPEDEAVPKSAPSQLEDVTTNGSLVEIEQASLGTGDAQDILEEEAEALVSEGLPASIDTAASAHNADACTKNNVVAKCVVAISDIVQSVSQDTESIAAETASVADSNGDSCFDESSTAARRMPGLPEGECILNFDWTPEGPPIDAAQEGASVELEVDWSDNGPHETETRWSAWLPNGLTGNSAEWHWVEGPRPARAFLKNTFVSITDVMEGESSARSRSAPAMSRRREETDFR